MHSYCINPSGPQKIRKFRKCPNRPEAATAAVHGVGFHDLQDEVRFNFLLSLTTADADLKSLITIKSPYSGRLHSQKSPSCNAPIALAITGPCGLSIGHRVVGKTRIAILLSLRFCWYRRFLSVVTKVSYSDSALEIRSPLERCDHPRSWQVSTSSAKKDLNGTGTP